MSTADELNKLNELKEKGVITADEFEKQKAAILSGTPNKKSNLRWRIPLGIVAAIVFMVTIFGTHNKGAADTLPTCDSPDAADTLKSAFDESPGAQTYHYKAVDVRDMKETAYDKQAKNRACSAKLALNSADELLVKYTMQGKPEGGYILSYEADIAGAEAATTAAPEVAAPQSGLQDTSPEIPTTETTTTDAQEDPAVEACVQELREGYLEAMGGTITSGDMDEWAKQCKAEKQAK